MSLPTNPINRKEAYLNAIATGNTVDMPATPITREEAYLDYIAKNGGGSGGAENYAQLSGKPQINNVELESGNNSLSALGIAGASAVSDSEKDIYAVMGEMGAKNLNIFPYKNGGAGDVWSTNGIDFTVLADGSIDVNRASSSSNPAYFRCGIPTENFNPIYLEAGKKYILSGSVSGVGVNLRDSTNATVATSSSGEEELFNCSNSGNYYIIISVSKDASPVHALVKPMLRLASDTDNTYQRYAKTNKQLTDDVTANTSAIEAIENVTGAKNLAPNNASTTEMSPVTFTVNSDKSVSVARTGNHSSWRTLVLSENITLKAGTYILSSGYTGDEQYNVYFELSDYSSGSPVSVAKTDLSDVVTFTIQTDITNGRFQIPVRPGNSVFSNVTIKPMLRDARITDPTYVSHAMTNKELTEICDETGLNKYLGIMQNNTLYSKAYGFINVPMYRKLKHSVTLSNVTTLDGNSVTVSFNANISQDGSVGIQSDDTSLIGKIIGAQVTLA